MSACIVLLRCVLDWSHSLLFVASFIYVCMRLFAEVHIRACGNAWSVKKEFQGKGIQCCIRCVFRIPMEPWNASRFIVDNTLYLEWCKNKPMRLSKSPKPAMKFQERADSFVIWKRNQHNKGSCAPANGTYRDSERNKTSVIDDPVMNDSRGILEWATVRTCRKLYSELPKRHREAIADLPHAYTMKRAKWRPRDASFPPQGRKRRVRAASGNQRA